LAMALGTLSMVILYAVFSRVIPGPSASEIAVGAERLRGELEAQARAKLATRGRRSVAPAVLRVDRHLEAPR
jgi:hypothetical protein